MEDAPINTPKEPKEEIEKIEEDNYDDIEIEKPIEIKSEEDLKNLEDTTEKIEINVSFPNLLETLNSKNFQKLEILSLDGVKISSIDF